MNGVFHSQFSKFASLMHWNAGLGPQGPALVDVFKKNLQLKGEEHWCCIRRRKVLYQSLYDYTYNI